ncbi:MAG: leucine-rich repeat domain-containing protein [Simkaniaceae bacterium]|nr:leucine-rich repeat domain-containing protein [Simkaniaceae bacterium]
MSINTLSEESAIDNLSPLLSFRDLNALAGTSPINKALVDRIYSNLLEAITPLLNDYTWLIAPTSDSLTDRIDSLRFSLRANGFDIRDLSPTRDSIAGIFERADLTRRNLDNNCQALIAMYSRIPNRNETILEGTPVQRAFNIRRWMHANREALSQVTVLNLSHLSLTTCPHELDIYFPSLHTLNLAVNQLTTVPDFAHLNSLHTLNLSRNPLTTIPDFAHLNSLHVLYLLMLPSLIDIPAFINLPALVKIRVSNEGWLRPTGLLSPWKQQLIMIGYRVQLLNNIPHPSTEKAIFLSLHNLNITWRRDLRADVIRAYNARSQPDTPPLPVEWNEASLDTRHLVNRTALIEAFTSLAYTLTAPPV